MKTESLLASSPQTAHRHDVSVSSASHSVLRIPPRHSGPAYDIVVILDPATRAAQKYTPVIMVGVFSDNSWLFSLRWSAFYLFHISLLIIVHVFSDNGRHFFASLSLFFLYCILKFRLRWNTDEFWETI